MRIFRIEANQFVAHLGDYITIQKRINGIIVPNDIVAGHLQRAAKQNLSYNTAFVLIDQNNTFFVQVQGIDGYNDVRVNSVFITYDCTITRDNKVVLTATLELRPHGALSIPGEVPQIVFKNRHGVIYRGRLERATHGQ